MITVVPINDAPVAIGQTVSVDEDNGLNINLTASDPDSDELVMTVQQQPTHGTLAGTIPNLIYTPTANFHGQDSYTFSVNDGQIESSVSTVLITVVSINDAPVAIGQTVSVDEDNGLNINLTASDPDSDELVMTVQQQPTHGTLAGTIPNLIYTPTTNFHGQDSFIFTTYDGQIESSIATVLIAVIPVNDAPIADNQTLEVESGEPLAITLTGSDIDSENLSFQITSTVLNGTITGTQPNIIFTPELGFEGEINLELVANDGELDSQPVIIKINVIQASEPATNEPPTIISIPVTNVFEQANFAYDVNATDPNENSLTYGLDIAPQGLDIAADTGLISWLAPSSYAQSVPTFNNQCYVVSEDAEQVNSGNADSAFVLPLFQRVRTAISKGSDYTAPVTEAWHRDKNCLGCHVQTQTLLGLHAAKEKANVDEDVAEYLLSEVLSSQVDNGSFISPGVFTSAPNTQTAFAIWALSHVSDRDRTFNARALGLRFLFSYKYKNFQRYRNGTRYPGFYWFHGYDTGWLNSSRAMSAIISLTASQPVFN